MKPHVLTRRPGSHPLAWAIGLCLFASATQAADPPEIRIAVVSVETILEGLPERAAVEGQLSERFKALQSEVDAKWKEVAALSEAFQEDQAVLSQKAQAERQEEIIKKETELSEYWNAHADRVRSETESIPSELSRRVEDQIVSYARENAFTLIFEKSSGKLIYSVDDFDHTEEVMQAILDGQESSGSDQGREAERPAARPAVESNVP